MRELKDRKLAGWFRSVVAVRLKTCSLLLVALCLSCSTNGKEDLQAQPEEGTWYVTVRGKVGYPQQGQITIQELKDGGNAWQDTITLKGDYTFAKKVKLKEPGYYRINFYNKQMLNLIVHRSDIEVNVDGNSQQGFAEIKGSPDIDLIEKVQELQGKVNSDPAAARLNEEYMLASQRKDQNAMLGVQQKYMQ